MYGRGVLFLYLHVWWCPDWGGASRFQVWVCGTVRSLIWTQLLQLGKKFLEVILLVSGGGYFWGDSNGIDLGVGC